MTGKAPRGGYAGVIDLMGPMVRTMTGRFDRRASDNIDDGRDVHCQRCDMRHGTWRAHQSGHLAGLEEAVDVREDGKVLLGLAVLHGVRQVL